MANLTVLGTGAGGVDGSVEITVDAEPTGGTHLISANVYAGTDLDISGARGYDYISNASDPTGHWVVVASDIWGLIGLIAQDPVIAGLHTFAYTLIGGSVVRASSTRQLQIGDFVDYSWFGDYPGDGTFNSGLVYSVAAVVQTDPQVGIGVMAQDGGQIEYSNGDSTPDNSLFPPSIVSTIRAEVGL